MSKKEKSFKVEHTLISSKALYTINVLWYGIQQRWKTKSRKRFMYILHTGDPSQAWGLQKQD